jgi:hypothetical protein
MGTTNNKTRGDMRHYYRARVGKPSLKLEEEYHLPIAVSFSFHRYSTHTRVVVVTFRKPFVTMVTLQIYSLSSRSEGYSCREEKGEIV